MILKLLNLTAHRGSLLYRLLTGFSVIILLLVSLNILTFVFLRNSIRQEIIKNSSLNLNATVINYEKHLQLIKTMLLRFTFNDKTEMLKNNTHELNYTIVSQVQKELQSTLNNSNMYMNDVVYYFADIGYVIDKDGTREAGTMFDKLYAAAPYPASFWQSELSKPITFSLYPAAAYIEKTSFYQLPLGTLNPVVFKSATNPQFGIIAFLDSGKMYDDFHQVKTNRSFYILDDRGSVVFSAAGSGAKPLDYKPGPQAQGYSIEGTDYYFYEKGQDTGFTYVSVVPFDSISRQTFRLNLVMIAVTAVSIVIGVVLSVVFAIRFHNPLAAIIRSIQKVDAEDAPVLSPIKEFNVISEKLHDLSKTNETIHRDLDDKNSLLQHYAYLSRVKMLHTDVRGLNVPLDANKPFQLVLYQLFYKEKFTAEMGGDQSRASNYIKEFIHSLFHPYRDSLTLQIEKDQILTVLFVDEAGSSALADVLGIVQNFLTLDMQYCDMTIGVSPVCRDATAFNATFEYAAGLLKQRKLGEGVQVVREQEEPPRIASFTPAEEKEFAANMASGNDAITIPLVVKTLELAAKRNPTLAQMHELAKDIVNLAIKTMYAMNIPLPLASDHRSQTDALKECRSLEQFQTFFRHFLERSAASIRQKKAKSDHITSFVTEYVEEHFGGDLSLDVVAEKLNITGAYLSTYFKENTGINFSDFVNNVRMDKAMELLRNTDLKVQDIAQLVGYFTVASFNRMFKKHTGVTPGEYRRQLGSTR